jgi:hypothetical protein
MRQTLRRRPGPRRDRRPNRRVFGPRIPLHGGSRRHKRARSTESRPRTKRLGQRCACDPHSANARPESFRAPCNAAIGCLRLLCQWAEQLTEIVVSLAASIYYKDMCRPTCNDHKQSNGAHSVQRIATSTWLDCGCYTCMEGVRSHPHECPLAAGKRYEVFADYRLE